MELIRRLNALGVTDEMLERLEDATAIAEAAVSSRDKRGKPKQSPHGTPHAK